jgi:NifU-like protein involved in Fe-S cluster formation
MWKYSEKLMDHFMNPRNSGQLPEPDGHSEVGSPQCGDAMTLDLKVDEEGRISDIRFMTFGCAGAIAAASALTELARGRKLEDALSITNDQIVDYLGGMPEEKYHCSVMGHEALSAAVSDFRKRRDRVREHLDRLLDNPPPDLADLLRKGSLSVETVHPSWVMVSLNRESPELLKVLERHLEKSTGRKIQVRRIS